MSNLIDRYLLFRIRTKRDPEAFAKIYDRYVKALYRFTLLKLPSQEEAQDITAETFTKAWNFLQNNGDVTNIRALLYRVARNLIADYYRNRPVSVAFDAVTNHAESASTPMQDAMGSDLGRERELIEARAEMTLILEQLGQLKEDFRDVVMLRLVDGLAFDDIGDILGKTSGNVRVIYHRAIKALKEIDK
jgi:RNA polymerase sigma-70 factor (ECF subfamily)